MRIVVDTNIFVGACLGHGAPAKVIGQCLRGRTVPLMGTALYLEYESVLERQPLFRHSALSAGQRDELLDVFLGKCLWTTIFFGWRPNLPDEADNHLIELAVAGSAEYIVTRNLKDLDRGELDFQSVRMISPEAFIKERGL